MPGDYREVHPHLLTSRHIRQALYQREGGILAPERCVAALAAAARARGAAIHENEAVTGWQVDAVSGDVLVTTARSTYRGKRLVLTTGAWIPHLIPELKVCASDSGSCLGSNFETATDMYINCLRISSLVRRQCSVCA